MKLKKESDNIAKKWNEKDRLNIYKKINVIEIIKLFHLKHKKLRKKWNNS